MSVLSTRPTLSRRISKFMCWHSEFSRTSALFCVFHKWILRWLSPSTPYSSGCTFRLSLPNTSSLKMSHRSSQSVRSTQAVWVCMALALVLQITSGSPANRSPLLSHHLTKRSFFDLQCKGVYDKSIFARLDRICEDCYNLFREPSIHSLCRQDCFTTNIFKGCVETLQLTDELEQIQIWIKHLHGADPGV